MVLLLAAGVAALAWILLAWRLGSAGAGLLGLALVTITWNGVKVGIPVGDLLLFGAAALLAIEAATTRQVPRLPGLVWIGAAIIGLSVVLAEFFPPSQAYVENRHRIIGILLLSPSERRVLDLTNGVKFAAALVLFPLAMILVGRSVERLRVLAGLWVVSACVSCLVAISDATGATSISATLLGSATTELRAAGLSNHPNHLATAAVQALPVALYFLEREGRGRLFGAGSLAILCVGLYVSGSRAGLIAGVVVLLVTCLLRARLRHVVIPVLPTLLLVCCALLVLKPGEIGALTEHTRLGAGAGADAERLLAVKQAVHDFLLRPIAGIGYGVADQGHSIYLQLLASGGLLSLLGFFCYQFGLARAVLGSGLLRVEPLGVALALAVGGWLAMGIVGNDLVDRYPYAPVALLLALAAVRSAPAERPIPPSRASGTPTRYSRVPVSAR